MKIKINWKERLSNPAFITLVMFTVIPQLVNRYVPIYIEDVQLIMNLISLMAGSLGFVINPTTKGLSD